MNIPVMVMLLHGVILAEHWGSKYIVTIPHMRIAQQVHELVLSLQVVNKGRVVDGDRRALPRPDPGVVSAVLGRVEVILGHVPQRKDVVAI
jgi:hypothetical protein